ncbi:hypothetical protein, partial [Burkholderia sp. SIMBA_024]|uniref:hypothetical protein n=1 Tax=Burkholderia sp. SIMBA_024 TaxID=3085768 RepID=UPI00397CD695
MTDSVDGKRGSSARQQALSSGVIKQRAFFPKLQTDARARCNAIVFADAHAHDAERRFNRQ